MEAANRVVEIAKYILDLKYDTSYDLVVELMFHTTASEMLRMKSRNIFVPPNRCMSRVPVPE